MKKRLCAILLLVLLCLTMTACGKEDTYTVTRGNKTFPVDTVNATISDGEHLYYYTLSGNAENYNLDITYPDGSTYWCQRNSGAHIGGWSNGYEEGRYVDGMTLADILEEGMDTTPALRFLPVSILLAATGLWSAISPHSAWYVSWGWRYKDAEPSDAALTAERFGGIFAVFLAIVLLFL